MESSSFEGVQRNPDVVVGRLMQRAHNRDGLPEIVVGVIFLTVSLLMWVPIVFPQVAWLSPLGMIFLVSPMAGASPWAIKKLRRRYLIEREGYVEFKPMNRRRIAAIFGIAFVVGAATAAVLRKGSVPPTSWFLAGLGIWGGALAAYAGKGPRFVIGGGIMAVVGIVVGLSRVSLGMGQAILYGIMGLLSLVSGVIALLLFMRKPDFAGN